MRQRTEKDSRLLRALRENENSKDRGRRVWRSVGGNDGKEKWVLGE